MYEPAGFGPSLHIGIDIERHILVEQDAPWVDIYPPSSWEQRWPGQTDGLLGRMPVPYDLVIPDAQPPYTPNECSTFLLPEGQYEINGRSWTIPEGEFILQLEPTCRAEQGAQIVGWVRDPMSLRGDGRLGSHWGSGLSTLGGSIRLGELSGPQPIRHALKLNVRAQSYLYYSLEEGTGYRWPADRNDDYASTETYGGTNPAVLMGSLLAILPSETPESLGILTAPGRKLFHALQDYGAYIADDTAWDAYDWCAEIGVIEEVRTAWSLEMSSFDGDFFDDSQKLVQALHVVTNNGPDSLGGGGIPRRPLAPALPPPTDN